MPKAVIHYNYELLMLCVARDRATLDSNVYTTKINLTRDSMIEGVCKCGKKFRKNFKACYIQGGLTCKPCVNIQRNIKKINASLIKRGVKYSVQDPVVKEKAKLTNLAKRGVEYISQDPAVKQKVIQTNLAKRGVKCVTQDLTIQEKTIQTNLAKRGVKYAFQDPIVKDQIKQTNLKRRGVEHTLQDPVIQEKGRQTNLKIRGVEYASQDPSVKEKSRQTNLQRYGVEYAMQNSNIAERAFNSSFLLKDYTMPSQQVRPVQGYEPFALDILVNDYQEHDIITSRKEVPALWWHDAANKRHRHYVDIYISSTNTCIEVKSTWTFKKDKDAVLMKQQAAKDAGFKYEIWIFNEKKEIVEKHV
jgi:hypothetical protein